MDSETFKAVAKHYAFEEWRDIATGDSQTVVRDLDLPDELIEGIDRERVRQIALDDGTRLLRTTWPTPDGGGVNKLDLRECPSGEAALRVLLELLANMQSPLVERLLGDFAIGDIAFAQDPAAAIVFVRANIAVRIDVAPAGAATAYAIARTIDAHLIDRLRPAGEPLGA